MKTFWFCLAITFAVPAAFSATPMTSEQVLAKVKTYDELLNAIRAARAATQVVVEQAKVREAWETGRLIDQHVLQHKERADYDKQVILNLAKDLGTSDTELGYMLRFARAYPIYPTSGKLTWSDYRELLSLNDPKEREALSRKAAEEKWDVQKIRSEVKRLKAIAKTGKEPVETLTAKAGKPGTYRYLKATVGPEAGRNVIDLGFSNYYRTSKDLGFKDGTLIESIPAFPDASSPSDKIKLSKRTADDLYTYRAWIVSVLDGDTVKAVIDLGFGIRSVQVLRLRAIDCPELSTSEGQEAKKFVEKVLACPVSRGSCPEILIKTIKSDKYDRYLADVFVTTAKSETLYLNNELLKQGMAVRVGE